MSFHPSISLYTESSALQLHDPLPPPAETYNDMAFGDIFLHLLTGHLTLLSDEFGTEDFCSVVFDGFLLTSFSR